MARLLYGLAVALLLAGPAAAQTPPVDAMVAQLLASRENFLGFVVSDHPDVAPAVEQRLRAAYQADGTLGINAEAVIIGQEIAQQYLSDYVPYADDALVGNFLRTSTAMLRHIQAKSPPQCFRMMFGIKGPDDGVILPGPVERDLQANLLAIVRAAHGGPRQPQMAAEAAQIEITAIVGRMEEKLNPADLDWSALSQPLGVSDDAGMARGCATALALYTEILALPVNRAGPLFRTLMGKAEP